ncbi:HIRAN domain-containing protein [Halothiobacillus diazotrophicus]|uniref:HIRAN domain-containing protein n=1 Tax=Halothiobacillus diazotrophicus TaxID=1860122 RepID=UPI00214F9682|nr:HIRAN domain-containing protein [Halothiobacillus diazotrophicus]
MQEGDPVQFVPEPNNSYDSKAIRIERAGKLLGYVPRGHLEMLHRMQEQGAHLSGEIFRKNGSAERPLIYVLTQILLDHANNNVDTQLTTSA